MKAISWIFQPACQVSETGMGFSVRVPSTVRELKVTWHYNALSTWRKRIRRRAKTAVQQMFQWLYPAVSKIKILKTSLKNKPRYRLGTVAHNCHIKTKCSQQITNRSHQIQIAHSKFKSLTANSNRSQRITNHSQQITNRSQQIQMAHSKFKPEKIYCEGKTVSSGLHGILLKPLSCRYTGIVSRFGRNPKELCLMFNAIVHLIYVNHNNCQLQSCNQFFL